MFEAADNGCEQSVDSGAKRQEYSQRCHIFHESAFLSRLINGDRWRTQLTRLGFVFGSAFRLNLAGMKDPVASHAAVGQSLRAVAEGVRERVGAGVGYFELPLVLRERER